MRVAKKYQDRLPDIKANINAAYLAFKENQERFYYWQRFVFKSTIDTVEETTNNQLDRPNIEFNICNAPISRLCGEFSEQEPQLYVSPAEGVQADEQMLEAVEGYVKHILYEASKHNYQYLVYRDTMSGGYSNWKVSTDYASPRSFEQDIFLTRPDRPAIIIYDPCATQVTKCDAKFWAEPYPREIKELQEDYEDVDFSNIKFTTFASIDQNSFNWAYTTNSGKRKYVMVVDYYEVKHKKTNLLKLADNSTLTEDEYEEALKKHNSMMKIEQFPAVIDSRWVNMPYVCRYVCVQNQVLDYQETDFSDPNYIFVDGDSAPVQDNDKSAVVQFTKPYCYHAMGIQKLTNLSGQAIANDFENMVMHKFMVAEEALPEQTEFLAAYSNVQRASVLVYKKFSVENPDKPNDPPMPVPRVGLPQEVITTFNNCMNMLQNILGSYDASLGINDNQLSGVAMVEGATQSNAAAMPYIVNYMLGLNQAAQVIVNIMPKYLVTPRSIPIIDKKGQRGFMKINQDGAPSLSYNAGDLHVKVEAGVAFAIAKDRALKQITALMQVSPLFAQFINEEGLDVLLDNLEFHGVEIVKEKADAFMQKTKQQQQQPSPDQQTAQAKLMDAQTNAKKQQADAQIAQYEMMIKAKNAESAEKEADTDRLKALTAIGENQQSLRLEANQVQAEENRTRAETGIAISQHMLEKQKAEHEQIKDIVGMANEANMQKHEMQESTEDE